MNRHTLQCGVAVILGLSTTVLSLSQAQTPILPAATIAERAVQGLEPSEVRSSAAPRTLTLASAQAVQMAPKVAPAPAARTAKTVNTVRRPTVQTAQRTPVIYQQAASRARTFLVRSTAYNSHPSQTDSTPFITATGSRTRFGVIALSRDLLRQIPYGSRVKIEDLSGRYNRMLSGVVFRVEDTMNARIRGRVDVWMATRSQAMNWGNRAVRITVLR